MMKVFKIALLAGVIGVGLSGCAEIANVLNGSSVASQAPGVSITTEKALTITHYAYDGIGLALKTAAENKVLRGSNAATAQMYYDKAGDAIIVADKADAALNEPGVLAAISTAQDAIASASVLVKGN